MKRNKLSRATLVVGIMVLSILILSLSVVLAMEYFDQKSISLGVEPYIGMTYSDYHEHHETAFSYLSFSFYEKENGDGVVVHFDDATGTIDDIRVYPSNSVTKTKESFMRIKEGMSLYEVVSLIGVPYRTNTSGTITMVFATDAGEEYSVYFHQDSSDGLVVARILELE